MAQDINEKIRAAAQAKNVDPEVALRIANVESGGKATAKNPRSSAEGIFQIIDDTWRRYGGRPGKKLDADENIRVGTDILADNTAKLTKALGRSPQGHEVYTAHFFGPEKGKQILQADPATPLNSLLSKDVLKANPELRNQTVGQFLGNMQNKMGKSNRSAGAGMEAGPTPSEETMTKALGQNIAGMGTGYQAALALSFLSDEKGDKEDDEEDKDSGPSAAEQLAQYKPVNSLEGMDIGYSSPFAQPQAAQPQQVVQAEQPQVFAHGGVVHRADGSPEYGEIPTGGITEDTMTTFRRPVSAREMLEAAKSVGADIGRGAISNAESLVRGAVSQVPGVVGDVESLGRKALNFSFGPGGVKVDEKTYAPTSEEIRAAVPRATAARPESAGMESLGEVMAPGLAKAATPAAKMVGKEAARQMLRGMEGEGPLTSISPPILYAREPGKAAAEGIFTHLPSNEAPFVGRLDEYISNLPGPVQKQQFFGQLKGKFRDYEIGRAEEALKDLPDNAKLTPSDLLNRVKEVYDPGRYKTTVLPPDPEASAYNNRWRSSDNIFYDKTTDEGVHLGVIHLNQDVPPEVAQRQMVANDAARAVKLMNENYYIGRYPEKMDALDSFLKTSGVQLEPELAKKIETGSAQYRKITNYEEEMKAAKDKLMYPNLDPQYEDLYQKYAAQLRETDPTMPNYVARVKTEPLIVRELADQANEWLTKNGYKPVSLPDYSQIKNPSMHAMLDSDMGKSVHSAFLPAKEEVGVADNNLAKYMKGTEEEFRKAIGHELPYMGQHESLGGGPAQIAFSRYSEHTANVPGMGPTQGIYVHELQSDMLDDLRKLGPKRASKASDQEEYSDTLKKLEGLEKARSDAYQAGNNKLVEELDNQLLSIGGRAEVLSRRIQGSKTNYSMSEAFHRMETGGKTAQQLMAKNAIIGAIQQGKNFVAFPGKESAQAKLYEKLPRNLKDVVKDLGPGFELRDVELKGPMGKSMHNAIVWGPEAAARIQKKGVPFATGGSVDKANIDHRKYL